MPPLRGPNAPVRGPRIAAAVLKEFSEPLGLLGTEPDDRTDRGIPVGSIRGADALDFTRFRGRVRRGGVRGRVPLFP